MCVECRESLVTDPSCCSFSCFFSEMLNDSQRWSLQYRQAGAFHFLGDRPGGWGGLAWGKAGAPLELHRGMSSHSLGLMDRPSTTWAPEKLCPKGWMSLGWSMLCALCWRHQRFTLESINLLIIPACSPSPRWKVTARRRVVKTVA